MPRNGSGVYSSAVNFTTEAGSPPIEISRLDQQFTDVASALTASIASDGQTSPSANLPMNGFKHTGCAAATALTDYARVSELIDQDHTYYVDSGSANTYAITPSPAITAYEEGQKFVFRAANTNTGASTLNVNSEGAIAIQTIDGTALKVGVIVAGGYYEVVYDANSATDRWILMSPAAAFGTFTATVTGMTGATTGTATYRKSNGIITLYADASIAGTSNTTAMTMTGLPTAARPEVNRDAICPIQNNGSVSLARANVDESGTITFQFFGDNGIFSSSGFDSGGTKGVFAGWTIVYPE